MPAILHDLNLYQNWEFSDCRLPAWRLLLLLLFFCIVMGTLYSNKEREEEAEIRINKIVDKWQAIPTPYFL